MSRKALEQRTLIISAIFIVVALIFIIRLFYVQVLDDKYKLDADNNSKRHIIDYPARGLLYDRNGKLLVYNEAAYDLMVLPRQVSKNIDTMQFCRLLKITKENFIEKLKKAQDFSYYKPSIFESEFSSEEYARIQENLFKYPGFYVQTRTLRNYPEKTAAHILGYISEVNQKMIEENSYYKPGDYIGISGIEKSYEEELRGKRGIKIVMVDVFNREKGKFANGIYDSTAVSGKDLNLTIDADLQAYGELLMQNKKGSIVAIEPKTGEILTLVSAPTYDPNLLVGRERSKNYSVLNQDPIKPLFNRALMAKYPPGSTFKSINALIGLQEGVLTPQTLYSCRNGYNSGRFHMGCHSHPSPVNLEYSIQTSCNSYYSNVFRSIVDKYPTAEEGYKKWRSYVLSFGLGKKTGIDLPNELNGFVPNTDYYDRYYLKGRWNSLTIVSLAIGQGELGFTPLQMANMTATIANGGYYVTPHIVKKVGNNIITPYDKGISKQYTGIDTSYFNRVKDAMYKVVQQGTGTMARVDSIKICGKTGTVQNPHGDDHSTFIAFAPKDNPQIAITVYVENGVWGSRWAAPMAGLMIEKYLKGRISRKDIELRMIEGNLISNTAKKK